MVLEKTESMAVETVNTGVSEGLNSTINNMICRDVTTLEEIRSIHFLNSCRLQPFIFSCAVDSFLEISTAVFFEHLHQIVSKSEFFEVVCNACDNYSILCSLDLYPQSSLELQLSEVRTPVWNMLCTHCSSFSQRNCDAQFSEIFSSTIFQNLSHEESLVFKTTYSLTSFCSSCNEEVISQFEILVTFVRHFDLNQSSNFFWPVMLNPLWKSSSLQCSKCERNASPVTVTSYLPAKILFIEFSVEFGTDTNIFYPEINVGNFRYRLKALVRSNTAHFTCAVLFQETFWLYIDDMHIGCRYFNSLSELFLTCSDGWFFAIYVLVDEQTSPLRCLTSFCHNVFSELGSNIKQNLDGIRESKASILSSLKSYELRSKECSGSIHDKIVRYVDRNDKINENRRKQYNKKKPVKSKVQREAQNARRRVNYKHRILDKPNCTGTKKSKKPNCTGTKKSKMLSNNSDKEAFLLSFDSTNGKLHEQRWALENMHKFHKSMKMIITQCTVCKEAWPLTCNSKLCNSPDYMCLRCKRDNGSPRKFSFENNMVPSKVPAALQGLTQVEEMLIARAFPVIQVYTKPRGGQRAYKGHVITFPQDIQQLANILPRVPEEIPIILFKFSGKNNYSKELIVRRQNVLDALLWLTGVNENGEPNNVVYKNVTIDYTRVQSLPDNDFIVKEIKSTEVDNVQEDISNCELPDLGPEQLEKVHDENSEIHSFLPTKFNHKTESTILTENIFQNEVHSWTVGSEPLNEFNTNYLATMAFPTLFPDGTADPTNCAIVRNIASSETEAFAEKVKHLIKFGEQVNGKWIYRFACHPRFAFWAYNILYRRRLLGQGNFFLKQNPGEANLTLEDLQQMLMSDSYEIVMKKLLRYAKNVTGTNAYWHEAKEQLKAIISQMGPPTIFWTLSCADLHWPEFHSLLSLKRNPDYQYLRDNIINNPHLIDWFFTQRTENFVKFWLYESLGAKWHWYRFEYALQRGSIHCHGVAKLKNDPGLCNLTQVALKGFLAGETKKGHLTDISRDTDIGPLIIAGAVAQQTICKYVDFLMSACNPCCPDNTIWVRPIIHPCKKDFNTDINLGNTEEDYVDLINSVQRHTVCNSAYCLRTNPNGEQYCRFHFPCELRDTTQLVFEKITGTVQYKPVLQLKRNDCRLNKHQRLQIQGWRANCDIQPILDYHACLEYLTKYASKGEKISAVVKDAFVSVISSSKSNDSNRKIVQKLMMKSVGERDWSAQEVMHHIMSLKLVSSTYQVFKLSLEGSRRILISNGCVDTKPSFLDHYADRCNYQGSSLAIRQLNLCQFVSQYNIVSNRIVVRPKSIVLQTYPSYYSNPDSPHYPLFCKYQLIKYKPWEGRVCNVWGSEHESPETFCLKWNSFLQSELGQSLVPNWARELMHAESYFSHSQEQEVSEDNETDELQTREEWMHLSEMYVSAEISDTSDLDYWTIVHDDYSEEQVLSMPTWVDNAKLLAPDTCNMFTCNILSLNENQRLAYDIVKNHVENRTKQLLMIVTGMAGSGKSFVINNLRGLLGEKCRVCSFFGIAAFNVRGKTLHSLLKLPIRGKYLHELKGSSLSRLQQSLSSVSYLIIDEFSVIGQNMLGWIDRRCRQITGDVSSPFGGINIILVGDIAQLPPVGDKVLYHKKPESEIGIQGYCMYMGFDTVVKLTVNQRSIGEDLAQQQFRDVLINLRNGKSTEKDWKLLLTRTPYDIKENLDLTSFVKLSFSNEKVATANYKALRNLRQPIAVINARHNSKVAQKLSVDEMSGLEPKIFLSIGARVMLTRNIWPDKGLCNGSMGYVKDILYKEGEGPPSLPIAVIIKFDSAYIGPSILETDVRCVPIIPCTSVSDSHGDLCERQQLPLKLSWSITIHKSQGLTLDKAWIDLGFKENCSGLAYVALSRVRSLKDLLIEPMSLDRLHAVSKTLNFKFRLEEENRLSECYLRTKADF